MKLNQQEILDVQITQLFHEFLEFLVTYEMCHILHCVTKRAIKIFDISYVLSLVECVLTLNMNQNGAVHIVLRFSVKLCYFTAKLTNNKPHYKADLQICCHDYEE